MRKLPRNWRSGVRSAPIPRQANVELDTAWIRDTSSSLGGLAVFHSRLGITQEPQPRHVHVDCARHRHGVDLLRGCHRRASSVPGGIPYGRCRCGVFPRRQPSSQFWSCSARCWGFAREDASGAIPALLDLAPKTVMRVTSDGKDGAVPTNVAQGGDRLCAQPGEQVGWMMPSWTVVLASTSRLPR